MLFALIKDWMDVQIWHRKVMLAYRSSNAVLVLAVNKSLAALWLQMQNIHNKVEWFICQIYILFVLWRLPFITWGWIDYAYRPELWYMKSLADIRHLRICRNSSPHTVNTSRCVYSTLSIRQTCDNFTKFFWQHVFNLFSSIQHFDLSRTCSVWVHTPQSSAITICITHARTQHKKWGKPTVNNLSWHNGWFNQ